MEPTSQHNEELKKFHSRRHTEINEDDHLSLDELVAQLGEEGRTHGQIVADQPQDMGNGHNAQLDKSKQQVRPQMVRRATSPPLVLDNQKLNRGLTSTPVPLYPRTKQQQERKQEQKKGEQEELKFVCYGEEEEKVQLDESYFPELEEHEKLVFQALKMKATIKANQVRFQEEEKTLYATCEEKKTDSSSYEEEKLEIGTDILSRETEMADTLARLYSSMKYYEDEHNTLTKKMDELKGNQCRQKAEYEATIKELEEALSILREEHDTLLEDFQAINSDRGILADRCQSLEFKVAAQSEKRAEREEEEKGIQQTLKKMQDLIERLENENSNLSSELENFQGNSSHYGSSYDGFEGNNGDDDDHDDDIREKSTDRAKQHKAGCCKSSIDSMFSTSAAEDDVEAEEEAKKLVQMLKVLEQMHKQATEIEELKEERDRWKVQCLSKEDSGKVMHAELITLKESLEALQTERNYLATKCKDQGIQIGSLEEEVEIRNSQISDLATCVKELQKALSFQQEQLEQRKEQMLVYSREMGAKQNACKNKAIPTSITIQLSDASELSEPECPKMNYTIDRKPTDETEEADQIEGSNAEIEPTSPILDLKNAGSIIVYLEEQLDLKDGRIQVLEEIITSLLRERGKDTKTSDPGTPPKGEKSRESLRRNNRALFDEVCAHKRKPTKGKKKSVSPRRSEAT